MYYQDTGKNRVIIAETIVIVISFLIPSLGVSTYFYLDDYPWLRFASDTIADGPNFLHLLAQLNYWGFYRPALSLTWIILNGIGGFNPYVSQLVLVLFYMLSTLFLMRLTSLFSNRVSGIIAGLLFLSFIPAIEMTWYRSALSLWGELCFALMAAYYFISGVKNGVISWKKIVISLFCATISFGMKESAILLPLTLFLLKGKKRWGIALLMVIISSMFIFIPRYYALYYGTRAPRDITLFRVFREGNPQVIKSFQNQIINNFELFFFKNYFNFYTVILFFLVAAGYFLWKKSGILSNIGTVVNSNILDPGAIINIHVLIYGGIILNIIYLATKGSRFNYFILVFILFSLFRSLKHEGLRFYMGWCAVFLFPPLVMGVGTKHQLIEASAGVAGFSGIGLYFLHSWWKSHFLNNSVTPIKHKRLLVLYGYPIGLTLMFFIILFNLSIHPTSTFKNISNFSQLNNDVCSYLEKRVVTGVSIESNFLPGMISPIDIVTDIKFRKKNLGKVHFTDLSNYTADIIVIGSSGQQSKKTIINPKLSSNYFFTKKFKRGPYSAKIYFKRSYLNSINRQVKRK